jgi:hypothetical protein
MVAPRKRGYAPHLATKEKSAFTGKVPRSKSPNDAAKVDIGDQFHNAVVDLDERGGFKIKTMETPDPKKGGADWDRSWHGNGMEINPLGDMGWFYTGTHQVSAKKGEIKSTNGASDTFIGSGVRESSGNDGKTQKDLPVGGGHYCECAGNKGEFATGLTTGGTAANFTHSTTGKMAFNAEGGVGIGVNKSSDMKVWTRWEPDGTFHIQVKPKGAEGGNATVKILPSGEITITTVKSMTITANEKVTIIGKKGILLKSGGDIITDGKTTKIQKGGPKEDPRTFV